MSRSQRHRVLVMNYPVDCKVAAEGVAAPGYTRQGAGPYVQPVGPAGGPLQGSSLAGPAPAQALPTFGDIVEGMQNIVQAMGMTDTGDIAPPTAPPPVSEPLKIEDPGNQSVPDSAHSGTVVCELKVTGGTPPYTGVLQQDAQGQFEVDWPNLVTKGDLDPGDVNVSGMVSDSAGQNVNLNIQVHIWHDTHDNHMERIFPFGPIVIAGWTYDDASGAFQLTLVDLTVDIREGDTVTIEASGSTEVNGSYPITIVNGTITIVMPKPTKLPSNGRLTVTGGV